MIRRVLFLLVVGISLFACGDDEIGFDVPVEFQRISFDPVPGGAVMRYKLPDDVNIFGVRARYVDSYGETLAKDGSYLSDTLLLSVFIEALTAVPVQLTFFNSDMEESAPIEMTFSTEAAAVVAVFDNLTVNPFWGGFNVTYTAPETVEGTIHVFYIGTNPATQRPDSILMGSYPIMEGGDTLNFEIVQDVDQLDVVVRTDDYEGHRIKTEIFRDVPSLTMAFLEPENFDFSFTGNIQGEGEYAEGVEYGFGKQYLFDGKKKGDGFRSHFMYGENQVYETFVAGPYAFNERFIFDLRTPKIPAAIYAYAFLNFGTSYPQVPHRPGIGNMYLGNVWHGTYPTRLPCKVKVYGTNENPETVELSACSLLHSFDDSPYWENWYANSWCKDTDDDYGAGKNYKDATDEEFEEAEPIVLRLTCNYTGESFRYLILVVEDTYFSNRYSNENPNGYEDNPEEYVTFDELEVFVRAE